MSIIEELRRQVSSIEVLYVGTKDGLEAQLVPDYCPFETVRVKGLERKLSISFFSFLYSFFQGFIDAIKILRRFQPDVVLGTGGYVSAPIVLAAIGLRIPVLIQEQNAEPGLTNRILGRFAEAVAISFPGTERFFPRKKKVVLTGNPVREKIIKSVDEKKAIDYFNLDPSVKTLLVFGGSRGAQSLNQALLESYPYFAQFRELQIVHITGKDNFDQVKKEVEKIKSPEDKISYLCLPYLKEMELAYAIADLVVSRAGATTVAEIISLGLPAILIPYPYATRNHQEKNAKVLERFGAARVLLDSELNGRSLFQQVRNLIFNDAALNAMREKAKKLRKTKAAAEIARLILTLKASSEMVETSEEESEDIGW